jgi:peptidoglycan/LPS O-acetylase OafA/YrhL
MTPKTRQASAAALEHIPALDGIRAVAVLAIIATHSIAAVPGAFLGVDTFFALSGYLITSLLVREWLDSRALAVTHFWSRRVRRLLPALFVMLMAVGVGAALWPKVFSTPALRGDTVATVFQVANWHSVVQHAQYAEDFSRASASPLQHTWSLAIEEQFYLVWPLVVLGVLVLGRRRRPHSRANSPGTDVADDGTLFYEVPARPDPGLRADRHRLTALFSLASAGALVSAIWMAVITNPSSDLTRSYYGSDTRAQSILVGAALALACALWGPVRRGRVRAGLWAVGICGVVVTLWLWLVLSQSSLWAYRGGFFLAAVSTAAVIACVANLPHHPITAVLGWKPLRYVGKISYGMYLWYVPTLLVLSPTRTHLSAYPLLVVRIGVIIAIATASAYLVELPIRRGQLPTWWTSLAIPTAATLAVLTTFLATVEAPGAAAASARLQHREDAVTAAALTGARRAVASTTAAPVKVLIVGDSLAGTLGVGFGRVMAEYDAVAVNEGSPGCSLSMDNLVHVLWFTDPPGAPCKAGDPSALLDQWRAWVDQWNPDVVVYMARSDVLDQQVGVAWTHIGEAGFSSYLADRFRQAVAVLGSRGARVVMLTSPYYDSGVQPGGAPWPEDDPARVEADNAVMKAVASSSRRRSTKLPAGLSEGDSKVTNVQRALTVIDVGSWLSPGRQYSPLVDGVTARCNDGVHFTVAGGELVAKRLLPEIVALGRSHQLASPAGSWSGDLAVAPPYWYSKLPCPTT